MYHFPNLKPVCCSMSGSNCCFVTCIQISQEAGKVFWYSCLFKNFPQFVVIHTVKGFSIVNEAEVDVFSTYICKGFPGGISGKEPACQHRRHKRRGFSPWVGKIPWRGKWQPTPVFLPGKSHGQRSLVGYSPWGCKESNTTESEQLSLLA